MEVARVKDAGLRGRVLPYVSEVLSYEEWGAGDGFLS